VEWRYGGLPRHENSECKNLEEKFSQRFCYQEDILLIDYIFYQEDILLFDYNFYQENIFLINCIPKDQAMKAENYPSLLVQLKDILKEKSAPEVKHWRLVFAR